MNKIKILSTEITKEDPIVKALIGTTWSTYEEYNNYIIIDCCGG